MNPSSSHLYPPVPSSPTPKTPTLPQNPKLQQPPLQLDMNPRQSRTVLCENHFHIAASIDTCIEKIQDMVVTVKDNERVEKYFAKAKTNRAEIGELLSQLIKNLQIIKSKLKEPNINHGILSKVMTFMKEILQSNNILAMEENVDKAIWIIEFESKVMCSMEFIMTSLYIPYDITTKNKEDYGEVWKRIHFQSIGKRDKIKGAMATLKRMMSITTSAVINQNQSQWAISKLVSFGLSYPQYFLSTKEGQLRSMIFYRKPTIEMARQIWNLPENGAIREVTKLGLKNIKTNRKIYIPIDSRIEPEDVFIDEGNSIQVRVLYDDYLFQRKKKQPKKFVFCGGFLQEEHEIEEIILHIHGGGFLALSSRSMQSYTRRWSIELGIPVFSVDYRKPHEHRFPTAPNDCYRVYEFLVKSIHKYFNINPKKIIIAGDSAGGNLCFSTTAIIMRQKLPLPYGIFAAYPANDLQRKFSPSKIFAFTDPLLNPTMLLLCLKQYLGGVERYQNDPVASPIFLTQQFVGGQKGDKRFPTKWPRTRIIVGAQDPLYDDSLKTMQRMVSSGIDCKCFVYQDLSHGFMNLDFIVPQCEKTIKDSIKMLQELLK